MALLFIVFSYVRMLQAIRGSGEAMRSTLSGRENAVATRYVNLKKTLKQLFDQADLSCGLMK